MECQGVVIIRNHPPPLTGDKFLFVFSHHTAVFQIKNILLNSRQQCICRAVHKGFNSMNFFNIFQKKQVIPAGTPPRCQQRITGILFPVSLKIEQ